MNSKHTDINFLVLKKIFQNGLLSMEKMGIKAMIMNPLMKGLTLKVFKENIDHRGLHAL